MEDPFTLTPMELTPINSTLAFNLIDDLDINDRYWLQEADQDYSIFQQPISNLFSLDISSNCVFTSSENEDSSHDILLYPPKQEISDIQSHDGEVIHDNHDDDDISQIGSIPWFIAPSYANPSAKFSVKKKLNLALESLKKIKIDGDFLIQTWMPVKRGGKSMLTANSEAFYLSPNCHSLAYYREISKGFQFAAAEEEEENNKEGIDFVSRVFLKKIPDWTPDVKFFREDEYLRITYARQVNICGSLVLPVFKRDETSCLGVIEIVTTTQKVKFHQEVEIVSKALEAVDLRSYDVLCPPMVKACEDGPYQAALAEIKEILKFVCDEHNLPLAQTWSPCIQHGKSGIRHSEENYLQCLSTIDSACYIPHPQLLGFHEACSEHHLLIGEGLAGEALVTNQPCFSSDISAFSTKEYPLSHHARLFGLRASIAVRLRSVYTGSDADFVLEFILPFDCEDTQEQKQLLDSLSFSIQKVCRSLRVVTDQELLLEETRLQRESISPYSPCVDTHNFGYANETEPQREIKPIIVPLGYLQEDEGMEFKLTTHWDEDDETKLTREDHFFNNFAVKSSVEYDGDGYCKSDGRKRRTKSEKTISLQVLRPYFAGSLKDAAKSIGVCPTTLKRICRQHGITRWPSRKIKKVEHSLRKLQHVIDSVQGVEHSFQLSSLYNSISSNNTNSKQNSTKFNDQLKRQQFTTQMPDERLLKNNLTCQVRVELPTAPPQQVHVGKIMKLKVTFGEEKIRFSMQQHWQFKELRNEIAKRFNIEEYCNSNRIEIKYLDDDSEWVLLECDADLDECLEVHNSCGSSMIKLIVHRSF